MIENILMRWYAMWVVPRLEKQIYDIDKDLYFKNIRLQVGRSNPVELATEIHNLKIAKGYITHKCDRLGGWL